MHALCFKRCKNTFFYNFLFQAKKESCKEKLPSPLAFYFAKKRAPYAKNLNLQFVTTFLTASNRQIFLTLNAASFFASRYASSTQNTMRRQSWYSSFITYLFCNKGNNKESETQKKRISNKDA